MTFPCTIQSVNHGERPRPYPKLLAIHLHFVKQGALKLVMLFLFLMVSFFLKSLRATSLTTVTAEIMFV